MMIIIPMSGIGKRFIDAGFEESKPLIEVDGKPIIEHVVNLFPGESNFIFICNSEHLRTTPMRAVLERIAPFGKIVEIQPHKKGPVFAVSQVFDLIEDEEEVIVNYCDFSVYWKYHDFLNHTRKRGADGAIPSYKGFHPHMLGGTNYAFQREDQQWMKEIKEKEPFTENRMNEYASVGTYYFRKGKYVKKYFILLMERGDSLKGEYYASLVFNYLIKDNLRVSIYEVQHMLQWGEPGHLAEYKEWSEYFEKISQPIKQFPPENKSINLIPLAGKGSRFLKKEYSQPKPLIEVSGKPMVVQAASYLPTSEKPIFVCLKEHLDQYGLDEEIRRAYPNAKIIILDNVAEGQAITCRFGLENEDLDAPLLIAACDNGMLWDADEYSEMINDRSIDVIAWSFRNHPSTKLNPEMYGWIKVGENNKIERVSVKQKISDNPKNDHAVVGTFYFRKARFFLDALNNLIAKNIRVNGEFYVDSCLNEVVELGLNAKVFEIGNYICWGTPNDYKTYLYWQSFFFKCDWHPYSLEKDQFVEKDKVAELKQEFTQFCQDYN
jgi:NDP-sugar pyrophosphorylase family protein